ncbi:MAG: adenylate/guanylate cyclase domain-containing protein, partial [Elusimicrobia bacterium]|nr:adenylate/guanylate cyclase domain-containing protein [Elusimicrobiota bacterium]
MAVADEKTAPSSSRAPLYIGSAFILGLGLLNHFNFFLSLDNQWLDRLFRWRGMEQGDPRVLVLAIDDESIKRVGQYPWPRGVYSRLYDRLFGYGVRTVGMDILFLDPSIPSEDRVFIQGAAKWRDRIVHATDIDPSRPDIYIFRYPFPVLRAVAGHFGFVNQLLLDVDGVIRRTNLVVGSKRVNPQLWKTDPDRLASLGIKVLSIYEGKSVDSYIESASNVVLLNIRGQRQRQIASVRDAEGNIVPIEKSEYGISRLSAWRVLEGNLSSADRQRLKGSIVLMGSTAVGAYDHFPTPFSELTPGVEVHANLIDNLLNNRHLRPLPSFVTWILMILFVSLSVGVLCFGPVAATSITLGIFLAWSAINYALFQRLWVVEFAAPSLALWGSFATLFVRKTLLEAREKRFIKQTFGQYVAPEVVDILVKNPDKIRLGGEKREMTVFFLDIAHFTTISEKMAPEALIQFLNHYLTALTDIILKNKGVVDKYIGDCIMAFWNAPIDEPRHRVLACLSAVECIDAISRLNQEYVDPTIPEKPAIRIGLNSGVMVVGNTGSARKLAYTVLGDEVNLASRLEGANKFFGSKIMASEACCREAAEEVEARELGRVRVVGKAVPIRVYELLCRKGRLTEDWQRALVLYRR